MSLHRVCCCGSSCGDCPCRTSTYSVNWSGSVSFVSDGCACRNTLGERRGIRVNDFTVADGTTRSLTNRVIGTTTFCDSWSPAIGGAVSHVLGTAAFKQHYDNSCTLSTTCPNSFSFDCDLDYGVQYTLYKPNDPVCKWTLRVKIRPLGRRRVTTSSPFWEMDYLNLWYEGTYSTCSASSITMNYLGAAYDDATPVVVNGCVESYHTGFGVSEAWHQGKISAITAGTVTIS